MFDKNKIDELEKDKYIKDKIINSKKPNYCFKTFFTTQTAI
jgi:hypothetical protein